jgi:hypothetical protein
MKVRVTVRSGDDVSSLVTLIDQVRAKTSELKVIEAPKGIDYSYSFPVVTVGDGGRHFGDEAVEVLRRLAD